MSEIIAIGFDGDGQQRITRNGEFTIVGGSQESHERMQEVSIKFNESLKGRRVQDLPPDKVVDLMRKATGG